jgi:serine/threonine protein kinase
MTIVPSPRDVLACLHARQQKLLGDPDLEAAVRAWVAGPARPLVDVLVERGKLSAGQAAVLRGAVDRAAQETCADPIGARVRELPRGVRELLDPTGSFLQAPATERPADTRTDRPSQRAPGGAADVRAGLTPGERFDIQQVLAQGGLGIVFLARDREIDRTVALKQIKSQWADDQDSRARFLLEARVTGRLEHPGVAPVYALGSDDTGRPYYAMRLIRGESLLEVIDRFHRGWGLEGHAKRMSELRKLLLRFLDVCNAVDYAHSKGVLHRDIKPSNIMLGKYGETLVVDWGLAKVIGSDEDVALTTRMAPSLAGQAGDLSTKMGAAIGTPAYMSPEQAAGRNDELSPSTDVYSLGATLYHMFTGRPPHAVEEDVGVTMAAAGGSYILPPRRLAPWLPRPLESICLKALAAAPTARYISARVMADEVQRWLADEPVFAHREGAVERVFRWFRNHRTLSTALVVAYLGVTLAAAVGVFAWNHAQNEKRKLQDKDRAAATGSANPPRELQAGPPDAGR